MGLFLLPTLICSLRIVNGGVSKCFMSQLPSCVCYLLALPSDSVIIGPDRVLACTLHTMYILLNHYRIRAYLTICSRSFPSSLCSLTPSALWICLIYPDALLLLGAFFTWESFTAAAEDGLAWIAKYLLWDCYGWYHTDTLKIAVYAFIWIA